MPFIDISNLKSTDGRTRSVEVAPLMISVRKSKGIKNKQVVIRLSSALLNAFGAVVGDRVNVLVDPEAELWALQKVAEKGLRICSDGKSGHGRVSFSMRPGLGIPDQEAIATSFPVSILGANLTIHMARSNVVPTDGADAVEETAEAV